MIKGKDEKVFVVQGQEGAYLLVQQEISTKMQFLDKERGRGLQEVPTRVSGWLIVPPNSRHFTSSLPMLREVRTQEEHDVRLTWEPVVPGNMELTFPAVLMKEIRVFEDAFNSMHFVATMLAGGERVFTAEGMTV